MLLKLKGENEGKRVSHTDFSFIPIFKRTESVLEILIFALNRRYMFKESIDLFDFSMKSYIHHLFDR